MHSALVVSLARRSGKVDSALTYVPIDWRIVENVRSAGWTDRCDAAVCRETEADNNCLDQSIGTTRVDLVGDQHVLHYFETNIGNFVT